MKNAAARPTRRRLAAAGLAAAAVIGATGCSAINAPATTFEYDPSDGTSIQLGDVVMRNIALVSTADQGGEGRFIGTIANESDQDATVTFDVDGTTVSIDAPAAGTDPTRVDDSQFVVLEQDEHTVPETGVFPGEAVDATVSLEGGESVQGQIPVLDGTLPEYRQFVPGGEPNVEEQTGHLYDENYINAPEEGH